MSWYLQVMKKYATFSGRARRKEYWMFSLFNAIIYLVLIGASKVLFDNFLLAIIYDLAIIIPALAVSVRRLHDINKSGFWVLISFIPVIGGIWLLVLTCMEGTPGENRFGANPKAVELIDVA
nr:DUF805 domain-containing protein [uncultured Aminipila sp.]